MNGIEALQALKDGKTVRFTLYYVGLSGEKDYTDISYYRYCSPMKDGRFTNKTLWKRDEDEWVWFHQKEIDLSFWMDTADGFEIVEEEE